ncbi:ABC ATPase [Blastomyces dermatitidis ER-3]|uniref:ABC ATPase n=1 Tax=Ajellomyces dermatitidis (strain ER-3 / ATCC MYA-2586) TaxID=559297 RepID=A0ABP2EUN7_AJEDR|nr:ABC ATPase [Blastomyces dermatitidis ER-3]EEQ86068.2 ABC ATPase [Blastomyces dermatitidis ER-3]
MLWKRQKTRGNPCNAIRQLRHEQLERDLFLARKNASLKSGSRGMQARKYLKAVEDKVAESARNLIDSEEARLERNREASEPSGIQEETQEAVDLLDRLQCQYEAPFESLSGGWRMRCMLAGNLIQKADILILDEPTNFLDLLGIVWLENYLAHLRTVDDDRTVVLVSHDRDFLNNMCEETIVLKDQTLSYFRGNLSAYEQDLGAQKLYWGRMKEAQDCQVAHMEATIRDNIKLGKKTSVDNKLRMAKSRQKKVDERMGVQVSGKGTRFKLNRDRVGFHDSMRDEIDVPQDEKGSHWNLSISVTSPGVTLSLMVIDLVIHMGDRVGIIGLNGSGKTTLLKVLVGSMRQSQGTVTRHPRATIGYYSQHSTDELKAIGRTEPVLTALSLLSRDANRSPGEGEVRGLLSSLGLAGRTASDVPITQLSGGQLVSMFLSFQVPSSALVPNQIISHKPLFIRVRLALARILWNLPHLLVLDEITTHLNFYTVIALVEDLSSFNGAILIVSHDRYLIRGVVEGKRNAAGQDRDANMTMKPDDDDLGRHDVYVLRRGKLHRQDNGVEQFEKSLQKQCSLELVIFSRLSEGKDEEQESEEHFQHWVEQALSYVRGWDWKKPQELRYLEITESLIRDCSQVTTINNRRQMIMMNDLKTNGTGKKREAQPQCSQFRSSALRLGTLFTSAAAAILLLLQCEHAQQDENMSGSVPALRGAGRGFGAKGSEKHLGCIRHQPSVVPGMTVLKM